MPRLSRPLWAATRPDTTTARARQYILRIGKWITGPITVLACISGLLTFYPVITVDVGSPLDPNNPFSYPFIVTNDTILPLFSVNISCRFDKGIFDGGGIFDDNTIGTSDILPIMAPHRKTTAPCHTGYRVNFPLKSGIATITISYYPFLWPIKTFVSRSFNAAMNSDNKTIWLPR